MSDRPRIAFHPALAGFNAQRFVPPTEAELTRYRAMTPGECVAMVGKLTREAWARTGCPWPSYPRAGTPVRAIRLADDR